MNVPALFPRPARTMSGTVAVCLVAVAAVGLAACTPDPPTGGGGGTETAISTFKVSDPSGPAPHTAAFSWTISDPEGDPLTCTLDLTTDGVVDVTIAPCTNSSLHAHTFPAAGSVTTTLVVSDQNSTPATKTVAVTVGAPSADTYDITLRLSAGMTTTQTAAFTNAAARWSDVITAGLPPVTLNVAAGACDPLTTAFSGTVDDLLIDGIIAPIDGPGGTLGQAGPCYVRTGGGLSVFGVMIFDTADVASLEANGTLGDVILHEMGHVLGIGTLWDAADIGGSGTSNPTFLAPASRAAYFMLGAGGNVPLANTGGAGTAEAHWRESTFDAELMTGYIDSSNPMSIQTVTNLADLGYEGVDLGQADAYSLPGGANRSPGGQGTPLGEILITPTFEV